VWHQLLYHVEGGYRDRGGVLTHISLHVRAVKDLKHFGACARRSSGKPRLTWKRSPWMRAAPKLKCP